MLRVLSIVLEEERTVLEFVYWLKYYYYYQFALLVFFFVLHFLTSLIKFILQMRSRWRTWWRGPGLSWEGPCSLLLSHTASLRGSECLEPRSLGQHSSLGVCSFAVGLCILWDMGAPCSSLHVGMWETKGSLLGPLCPEAPPATSSLHALSLVVWSPMGSLFPESQAGSKPKSPLYSESKFNRGACHSPFHNRLCRGVGYKAPSCVSHLSSELFSSPTQR